MTFFVTPSYQKLSALLFSITSHVLLPVYYGLTFTFNFLSLGMLSPNINLSSCLYFLSLNIFIWACFIFSVAFITLLSFISDFLIFFNKFISSITTFVTYIILTLNHFLSTSILSLSSLSTSICHLLRLLAFFMLLPSTYFNITSGCS